MKNSRSEAVCLLNGMMRRVEAIMSEWRVKLNGNLAYPYLGLMREVAHALTGKDVIVRFNGSPYSKYYAITSKREDGLMVIDMRLQDDHESNLKIFLHELAHVKLHSYRMRASNVSKVKVNSIKEPLKLDEKEWQEEKEADELRDHWISWARLNYKNIPALSEEERILKALLVYYKN